MPDAIFAHPRLAEVYDVFDADRSDLDAYVAIAAEFAAEHASATIVDVGCGTGNLAVRLAALGYRVIGVDPAAASLAIARSKPHAEAVTWIEGDATALSEQEPPAALAVMTGNVAQVFLGDDDWAAALRAVHAALRPGGRFVFETRRPEREAWREWTPERTRTVVRGVETWQKLTEVRNGLVSFRTTFVFDDGVLTSDSTLRFRTRAELDASMAAAGFAVDDVREAPDRPGREFVVLARRAT